MPPLRLARHVGVPHDEDVGVVEAQRRGPGRHHRRRVLRERGHLLHLSLRLRHGPGRLVEVAALLQDHGEGLLRRVPAALAGHEPHTDVVPEVRVRVRRVLVLLRVLGHVLRRLVGLVAVEGLRALALRVLLLKGEREHDGCGLPRRARVKGRRGFTLSSCYF